MGVADVFRNGSDREIIGTLIENSSRGINNFIHDKKEKLGVGDGDFQTIGPQDVIKNYKWSMTHPYQPYLEEVPRIILTEFQPDDAPLIKDLLYGLNVLGDTVKGREKKQEANADPYADLYYGDRTGNVYTLPFFSPFNHQVQNSWAESEAKVASGVRKGLDMVAGVAGVMERGGAEVRRIFQSTNRPNYSFSFLLYNTIEAQDIRKNFSFISTLLANNLMSRTSSLTLRSPVFYEVMIPGVRYSPAAYIQQIDVENVGQVNHVPVQFTEDRTVEMNVPDAWRVSINIHELMIESKQIFNGVIDPSNKVRVIQEANVTDEEISAEAGRQAQENAQNNQQNVG